MNFTDFYFFLQGHAISYSTSNERQKFSGRRGSRIKHTLINVCGPALSEDNSYQIRPEQPFVMTLSSTDEES